MLTFLTEATPAHEYGRMKDPPPSKTTMVPLSPPVRADVCRALVVQIAAANVMENHRTPTLLPVESGSRPAVSADCSLDLELGRHVEDRR